MKIYANDLSLLEHMNENGLSHLTKMAAMPMYGKTSKILLFQNQLTDGLET